MEYTLRAFPTLARVHPLIVASWGRLAPGAVVPIGEGPLEARAMILGASSRAAYLAQAFPAGMRPAQGRFYYEVSVD